jgi:hypothetical protein
MAISDCLYLDLKSLGIPAIRKTGSCLLISDLGTPLGRHSWVEISGWAIDAHGRGPIEQILRGMSARRACAISGAVEQSVMKKGCNRGG